MTTATIPPPGAGIPGDSPHYHSAAVRWMRMGALILMLLTGISFAGRMLWWADLLAHLRVHYAVGLLALSVVFFGMRHTTFFLLCVLGFFLNLYAVAVASPLYSHRAWDPRDVMAGQVLTVTAYNVHANRIPDAVVAWLKDEQPDVAVLIEANQDWQPALDKLASVYPYQSVAHSSTVYGMAILSRFPLASPTMNVSGPLHLPVLSAEMETPVGRVCVIGVHPNPPFGSLDILARNLYIDQAGAMARTRGVPCIMAGDFNATAWSSGFESLRSLPALQPEAWKTPATWPASLGALGLPVNHILLTVPVSRPGNLSLTRLWRGPRLPGSSHLPLLARIETQ